MASRVCATCSDPSKAGIVVFWISLGGSLIKGDTRYWLIGGLTAALLLAAPVVYLRAGYGEGEGKGGKHQHEQNATPRKPDKHHGHAKDCQHKSHCRELNRLWRFAKVSGLLGYA